MSLPNQRIIGEAEKNAAHTGRNDVKRFAFLAGIDFLCALSESPDGYAGLRVICKKNKSLWK